MIPTNSQPSSEHTPGTRHIAQRASIPGAGARRVLPEIRAERPRCPECDGHVLAKYRSIRDQGDGTALWWVKCARCEHRFRVVLE